MCSKAEFQRNHSIYTSIHPPNIQAADSYSAPCLPTCPSQASVLHPWLLLRPSPMDSLPPAHSALRTLPRLQREPPRHRSPSQAFSRFPIFLLSPHPSSVLLPQFAVRKAHLTVSLPFLSPPKTLWCPWRKWLSQPCWSVSFSLSNSTIWSSSLFCCPPASVSSSHMCPGLSHHSASRLALPSTGTQSVPYHPTWLMIRRCFRKTTSPRIRCLCLLSPWESAQEHLFSGITKLPPVIGPPRKKVGIALERFRAPWFFIDVLLDGDIW